MPACRQRLGLDSLCLLLVPVACCGGPQSPSIPGRCRVARAGSRNRWSARRGPAPPRGPGDAEQGGAVGDGGGELRPECGWRGDRAVEKLAGGVEGEQGGDGGVWAG